MSLMTKAQTLGLNLRLAILTKITGRKILKTIDGLCSLLLIQIFVLLLKFIKPSVLYNLPSEYYEDFDLPNTPSS